MLARDDGRAVGHAPARGADRRGRAGVAARRARDELLAVEHRRAAARAGACSPRTAGTLRGTRDRLGARCSRSAARSCSLAPGELHFGLKGTGGSADNATSGRAKPDRRRPRTVRETAAAGLRLGLVRNGVQAPHERQPGDRAERRLGLAHDPRHGRRRAGARRARRLRRAARGRLPRAVHRRRAARRRGSRSPPASPRSCCTPGPTPTSSRTRSPGRCSRSASRWRARAAPPRRRRRRREPHRRCSVTGAPGDGAARGFAHPGAGGPK